MKYAKWLGLSACIILLVATFMPWAYYPDLHKAFNGFYSEGNVYGKPGKFLMFFAIASFALILLPKIWAKRTHLILSALFAGYAIKSYILFTSCYNAICPEKKIGIYLVMLSCFIIFIVSIFPDMKIIKEKNH
jgi:hypothetical protein